VSFSEAKIVPQRASIRKKNMKIQSQNKIGFGILAALVLGGGSLQDVRAIGFLIPNQDASAIARGNAFGATADNPSAIYYNPAGITQIPGADLQLGDLNYFGLNVHYESPSGSRTDTKFEVIPVPQIYCTLSPTNWPVSVGLGVYAPFGLGVKWPEGSVLRNQALDSKLLFYTVNPVVAYKVTDSLSVGIGPTINYGKIQFNRGLGAAPADYYEFKGDDVAFGFNAGILWQPHPKWSFGANYRLATTMDFEGTSTYNPNVASGNPVYSAGTTASVPFPQIASAGVSFRPTPKWNIEVDVDYINWDTITSLNLNGSKNIFGANLVLPLNWHDSFQYKFGVTRSFENGWFVSAGYFFTSDTTSDTDFTPAVPDTDLHVGSAGFGRNGEHWHWAVAAQLIAGEGRTINAPNPAAGNYSLFIPTGTFSVGYRF
jgi:long-chain fatty acid transport protein